MAEGWIKVHWKLKASLVGTSAVATGVWVHLLLRASRRRVVLNNGTTLDTGELLINERGLASELEVSRKVLRRLIDLFESEGMVEVLKRDRNGTKLSICNWRTYQESTEQAGPIPNRNGTATGPQRDRNEPQSEIPKIPKKPKNGGFTPPTVDQVAEYIREKGYPLDAERFVAAYASQGWKLKNGRAMKCWKSAVTTWEKNRQDWERQKAAEKQSARPQDVDLRL